MNMKQPINLSTITLLLCISTLTSSTPSITNPLPAAVLHHAIPYGYAPDPNPPDTSKPKSDGVDEAFARRIRVRKAQEILAEEIQEKFISLYGQKVSMEAKCTSSDPGDQEWNDPMPIPYNTSTTDRVALEDHALRQVVRDAVKARKKLDNTDALNSEVMNGIGIVHDAGTIGLSNSVDKEHLNKVTEIDLLANDVMKPSYEKEDGVRMGSKIDLNMSSIVEQHQADARVRDVENVADVVEIE